MFFRKNKSMCYDCKSVATADVIGPSEYMYTATLEYVKALLASGNYEMVAYSHPIDALKDQNGYWVDDLIFHTIECKRCGTRFVCSCDTYHGRGRFTKEN